MFLKHSLTLDKEYNISSCKGVMGKKKIKIKKKEICTLVFGKLHFLMKNSKTDPYTNNIQQKKILCTNNKMVINYKLLYIYYKFIKFYNNYL